MKKIMFLIHNLGPGGAEKVLVNTVNNLDKKEYDVTVMALFDVGMNKQFLDPSVHYKYVFKKMFRGNSHLFKVFTPTQLHKMFIKEHYDVEIAYLEGPCARIISGCSNKDTVLLSWIHIEQKSSKQAAANFRSIKEAEKCYNRFDHIVCVSEGVKKSFTSALSLQTKVSVIYNPIDREYIRRKASESIPEMSFSSNKITVVGIGKLIPEKGFDRLINAVSYVKNYIPNIELLLLGCGSEEQKLKELAIKNGIADSVSFLGYQINPYKYLAQGDLFVCSSFREGYSTATIEALVLGIPVCTVNVSGMSEMLGENSEYGLIIENDEKELQNGLLKLLSHPEILKKYKNKAEERGQFFGIENSLERIYELIQ